MKGADSQKSPWQKGEEGKGAFFAGGTNQGREGGGGGGRKEEERVREKEAENLPPAPIFARKEECFLNQAPSRQAGKGSLGKARERVFLLHLLSFHRWHRIGTAAIATERKKERRKLPLCFNTSAAQ